MRDINSVNNLRLAMSIVGYYRTYTLPYIAVCVSITDVEETIRLRSFPITNKQRAALFTTLLPLRPKKRHIPREPLLSCKS